MPEPLPDTVGVAEALAPAVRDAVGDALTVLLALSVVEGVMDAVHVPVAEGVGVGVRVSVGEGEPVPEAEAGAAAPSVTVSGCQLAESIKASAERVACAPAESPGGAVHAALALDFIALLTCVTPEEPAAQPFAACAVASPATGATAPLAASA